MEDRQQSPAARILSMWRRLADPGLAGRERLFFELYGQALQGRRGTEGLLDRIVDAWVEVIVRQATTRGLPQAQALASEWPSRAGCCSICWPPATALRSTKLSRDSLRSMSNGLLSPSLTTHRLSLQSGMGSPAVSTPPTRFADTGPPPRRRASVRWPPAGVATEERDEPPLGVGVLWHRNRRSEEAARLHALHVG